MTVRRRMILVWAGIGLALGLTLITIFVLAVLQVPEYRELGAIGLATVITIWLAVIALPCTAFGALSGHVLHLLLPHYLRQRNHVLLGAWGIFTGLMLVLCVMSPLSGIIINVVVRLGETVSHGAYVTTFIVALLLGAALTSAADLTLSRAAVEIRRLPASPTSSTPEANDDTADDEPSPAASTGPAAGAGPAEAAT